MARSAGIVVVGQPAAVHMAEQVVLRAGLRVDVAQVDTGLALFLPSPHHFARTSIGTLTAMPDDERTDDDLAERRRSVFSGFGIASAALGLLSVAAIVLAV